MLLSLHCSPCAVLGFTTSSLPCSQFLTSAACPIAWGDSEVGYQVLPGIGMGCVSSFPSPILLGYLWQGNISQEGISLYLLQVVKCVLCYFQGVGIGEVSVSSSFHLSHFIPSVGSSSVQGPCSSKQVCRAVPCSPLYSKKQANPYLKIITVTFSWMRVPAVYKRRKGKAF